MAALMYTYIKMGGGGGVGIPWTVVIQKQKVMVNVRQNDRAVGFTEMGRT